MEDNNGRNRRTDPQNHRDPDQASGAGNQRAQTGGAGEDARAGKAAGEGTRIGDVVVGEIIGRRGWTLTKNSPNTYLTSLVWRQIVWIPHRPVLTTHRMEGQWHWNRRSKYGIHAYKPSFDRSDRNLCRWIKSSIPDIFNNHLVIIGDVALWGDIIEHSDGYRADWGYPVSFDYTLTLHGRFFGHPVLDKLRKLYLDADQDQ